MAGLSLLLAALMLPGTAAAGVSPANGNYYLSYTDYEKSDVVSVGRTYNSVTTFSGIFGYGWSSELEHSLEVEDDETLVFTWNGGGRTETFRRAPAESASLPVFVHPSGSIRVLAEGGYEASWRHGQLHRFDGRGRLVEVDNGEGEGYVLSYASGVIDRVAFHDGTVLRFTFYSSGKVARIVDADGRSADYHYNSVGDLIRSRDIADNVFEYEYDAGHNLTAIRYADGGSQTLAYDADGQLADLRLKDGCVEAYRYGANPARREAHYWTWIRKGCEPTGWATNAVMEWDFRSSGHVMRTWFVGQEFDGSEASPAATYREESYDSAGRLLSRVERQGLLSRAIVDSLQQAAPAAKDVESTVDETGNE